MEFVGEHVIPAPVDVVWSGLNDPETLRRSIPGCTEMLRTGETEFTASVVARVGPVSATFKGKVELGDLDPPHGYTLSGRGQGGPAGFAKGSAKIRLAPEGTGTRLSYVADVDIGGKLAPVDNGALFGDLRKGHVQANRRLCPAMQRAIAMPPAPCRGFPDGLACAKARRVFLRRRVRLAG